MEALISSGRIADVILVIMAIEVAVVSFVLWKRQQDLGLLSFVASLLAGGSRLVDPAHTEGIFGKLCKKGVTEY